MRSTLHQLLCTLVVAVLPFCALAQSYPDRPIKLVLPFPAGSATDGIARVIADDLRKGLGQPVVIENQAGADGNIASQTVKRAAPDGYTFFMSTNSAHGANKSLYASLPYDPERDFEPVAGLIRIPLMLLVRKDFPADDVAAFVQQAKRRATTKPLSFGTGNTSSQVAAALLQSAAGLELKEAPQASIVNVGSGQSLLPNTPDRSAYSASKGGVLNLTRALAAELAPSIRANTVCPGLVDTPMAEGVQGNVGNYALRRLAQPEEIARAILFLTSNESSYVTGAALAVDGGRSFH